jgi:deoxyribonuclease I
LTDKKVSQNKTFKGFGMKKMGSITRLFLIVCVVSCSLPVAFASNSDKCGELWEEFYESNELGDAYEAIQGLCGSDLLRGLRNIASTNRQFSYRDARQEMFSKLDNEDGVVCSVYSDRCLQTTGIPNHQIMNCEHSWPQSMGATGIAKSDLHHLYPVMSKMNSRRSNHPFCVVERTSYDAYGSALGYSEYGTRCFEPRDEHKGDVARSMFYFSMRYGKSIDSEQEGFFREWLEQDPVSVKETMRNDDIESFQKNRNPFVDHPEFVLMIDNF